MVFQPLNLIHLANDKNEVIDGVYNFHNLFLFGVKHRKTEDTFTHFISCLEGVRVSLWDSLFLVSLLLTARLLISWTVSHFHLLKMQYNKTLKILQSKTY